MRNIIVSKLYLNMRRRVGNQYLYKHLFVYILAAKFRRELTLKLAKSIESPNELKPQNAVLNAAFSINFARNSFFLHEFYASEITCRKKSNLVEC